MSRIIHIPDWNEVLEQDEFSKGKNPTISTNDKILGETALDLEAGEGIGVNGYAFTATSGGVDDPNNNTGDSNLTTATIGSSGTGTTGDVNIFTGGGDGDGTSSGDVNIFTGDASITSGNVVISTGIGATTKGHIQVNDYTEVGGLGQTPNAWIDIFTQTDDNTDQFRITKYSTSSNFRSQIEMRKARGTAASPLVVATGDVLGAINGWGYDGDEFISNSFIQFLTGTGGVSDNDVPGEIRFGTRALGGSSISTRMTITEDGNIGQGTTNPTLSSSSVLGIDIQNNGGTELRFHDTALGTSFTDGANITFLSSDLYINNRENGNILFYTNGSFRQTITSAGLVGIGTTSPTQKLHVYESTGTSRVYVETDDAATAAIQMDSNYTTTDSPAGRWDSLWDGTVVARIESRTGDDTVNKDEADLRFLTAEGGTLSERMRITQEGYVGIGTSSPTNPLVIESNATFGTNVNIQNIDVGGKNWQFKSTGSTTVDGAGNFWIRNATDGITAIHIESTGDIGIGTTNPQDILHVVGTPRFVTGNEGAGKVLVSDANGTGDWSSSISTLGVGYLTDSDNDTQITVDQGAADTDDIIFTNAGNENMRLDAAGNLKVGRSANNASTQLHVLGGNSVPDAGISTNSVIAAQRNATTANACGIQILSGSAADAYINFGDSDDVNEGQIIYDNALDEFQFWTNSAQRVTINSLGYVGINETDPQVNLHINDDIRLEGTNPNIQYWDTNGTADNKRWNWTANDQYLQLQALSDAGAGGGNLIKWKRTANQIDGLEFYQAAVLKNFISTNSDSYFTSGDVGIGTSAPSVRLEVTDSAAEIARFTQSAANGADAYITIRGSRNATTASPAAWVDLSDFDDNEGLGTEFVMGRVAGFMADVSGQTGELGFFTNTGASLTEKMRLDKNGFLGVGTTSPGAIIDTLSSNDVIVRARTTKVNGGAQFRMENDAQQWDVEVGGGDADRFRIDDVTNGTVPVRIDPGTPTSTLFLESTGDIGIGTGAPTEKLTIGLSGSGDADVNVRMVSTANRIVQIGANDAGLFCHAGTIANHAFLLVQNSSEKIRLDSTGVIVNENGSSLDFRVEGLTEPNLFFVDGSQDRIAIGHNDPEALLHVQLADSIGTPVIGSETAAIFENQLLSTSGVDVSIISGREGTARLNFGSDMDENEGQISYNHILDTMYFRTAGVNYMNLTSERLNVTGAVCRSGWCQYIRNTAQSRTTPAASAVSWNNNEREDTTFYSRTTDTITLKKAGWYRVSYKVITDRTDGAADRWEQRTYLQLNGTTTIAKSEHRCYGRLSVGSGDTVNNQWTGIFETTTINNTLKLFAECRLSNGAYGSGTWTGNNLANMCEINIEFIDE